MSITDELRKWGYGFCGDTHDVVTAIADCIDAEHERLMDEQYKSLTVDMKPMTDENMAADGWIRLPKDADGEYIRVGDVMNSKVDHLFDGRPFEVRALVLCEDGWEAADGRFGNRYEPDSLRHHHATTVEDVLREFAQECLTYATNVDDHEVVDAIEKYAKRMKLAEGEDA